MGARPFPRRPPSFPTAPSTSASPSLSPTTDPIAPAPAPPPSAAALHSRVQASPSISFASLGTIAAGSFASASSSPPSGSQLAPMHARIARRARGVRHASTRPTSPPPFPTMSIHSDGPSTPSFPAPPSSAADREVVLRPLSVPPSAAQLRSGNGAPGLSPGGIGRLRLTDSATSSAAPTPFVGLAQAPSAAPHSGATQPPIRRPLDSSQVASREHAAAAQRRELADTLALPHKPHLTILTSMAATPAPKARRDSGHTTTSSRGEGSPVRPRRSASAAEPPLVLPDLRPVPYADGPPPELAQAVRFTTAIAPQSAEAAEAQRRDSLTSRSGDAAQRATVQPQDLQRSKSTPNVDLSGAGSVSSAATAGSRGPTAAHPAAAGAAASDATSAPAPNAAQTLDSTATSDTTSNALSAANSHGANTAGGFGWNSSMAVRLATATSATRQFPGFRRVASYSPRTSPAGEPFAGLPAMIRRSMHEEAITLAASPTLQGVPSWQQRQSAVPADDMHGTQDLDWASGVHVPDEAALAPEHASGGLRLSAAMDRSQDVRTASPGGPTGAALSQPFDGPTTSSSGSDAVEWTVPMWKVRG